jgi:Ser/Thr protein kinase RdoA (MazF antagonist)
VPGKRPPSNPATRRKLGDLLGRLHTMATEAGPAERPAGSLHHLPQYEGGPGQDLAAARALLADLDGRVPDEHRPLYELIEQLLPEGDDCHGLPEAFLHPDPVRSNVIVTSDGPVLVDWTGAGRGPRLASLAALLHSAGPDHAGEVLAGYRRHTDLTGEELDRLEGVLWIRPLWLAAWQCWLVCVSPKVSRAFTPDRDYIVALAGRVRDSR